MPTSRSVLRARTRFTSLFALAGVTTFVASTISCGGGGGGDKITGPPTPQPVPVVASVAVAPATLALQVGQTGALTAQAKDASGASLGGTMTWTSSDATVAAVSGGTVTALKAGTATIAAAAGTVQGTASVTVTAVPVASVAVTPTPDTVLVSRTVQLTGTPRDAAGTVLPGRTISWTSGDTTLATVSATGLVTTRAVGTVTLTATVEGKTGTATVVIRAVPVASVVVTPATAGVYVTQTVQLTATTRDSAGGPLPGRAVNWAASDTSVAIVTVSGLVTTKKAGTVTIVATSEGQHGAAVVTVTSSVRDLLGHYAYGETIGSVKVFSDISTDFTHLHAQNLDRTWNFYSTFFGTTPGSHFEMYYTRDSSTYVKTFAYCPSIYVQNARQVNGCWNVYGDGTWIEFVMPYVTPDYGTQYHEVSHLFLNRVHFDAENYPWLKEGSGMYFESGQFDLAGNFAVQAPAAYVRQGFAQYDATNALIPLGTLLVEKRVDFYAGLYSGNAVREYAQAGMFFTYLMKTYPAVMRTLFELFKQGQLTTNSEVIGFITTKTARSIAQLESEYVAYGRSFR